MLEVKVGPPQLAIHDGYAVLITEPDGQINWPTDMGLYFRDTRLLSGWYIYANGENWELLNGGSLHHRAARIYLTNKPIPTEQGDIPAHALALVISRSIGTGVHEDLDITNYSQKPVRFNLELALRSDFADIFEVKAKHIIRRGHITTSWDGQTQRLDTTYRNQDFRRELIVQADRCGSPAVFANGRISFEVALEPGAAWHACLLYELVDGTRHYPPPDDCTALAADAHTGRPRSEWAAGVLTVETANQVFNSLYAQAVDDMSAMRLPEGAGTAEFVPAAGLPWFVALFGRDSLIVSLQNAIVCSTFAVGTLDALAHWQADARDDWRDAEPGKIPHELRLGELAHFKMIPHTPYYGTADATPLYPIVLHHAWRATGEKALLERHLATAERCLAWIDEFGDRDGDGFQEYQTRSPVGYENQSWKDSGEALVNLDGSPVKGPKALCELQGYVYDAWQRMAEIYDALGHADRAAALRERAQALFKRFNEAFWDEAGGFYAFCLDGEKRPVLSVASNPGQCLWSGIVPPDRAARVVRRLMQPDMWSGWGIRTLSAKNPSFNPYSYQNGAVWPHDNGIIALGFKRYGFAAEAAAIAHDVLRAASFFTLNQLPELYAGIPRDFTNFPVQYLGANVPQAWAAGSVFTLLQAMLGLQPDAPRRRLVVDPALPDWMPSVTLRGLQLGEARLDLRFERDGADTRFAVLGGDPQLVVTAADAAAEAPGA